LLIGKNVSITRCPLTRICSGARRRAIGRGFRTGQRCISFSSCVAPSSPRQVPTVSSTVKSPSRIPEIVPLTPGGIMILCTIRVVSLTSPMMSPGPTFVPSPTVGLKCHFFLRSRPGMSLPRLMNEPSTPTRSSSGRWIPS